MVGSYRGIDRKSSRFTIYAITGGAIAILLAACTSPPADAPKSEKLNVIIVHTDGWRAQATGFAGDPNAQTPNLDALAQQGHVFTNAVAGLAVCTPSRASLLTGQTALETGVFLNDLQLDTAAVTMAEIFAAAAYQTAFIGKWHLDGNGRKSYTPPGPRRQGFQYWKAVECSHNYNQSAYFHDSPDRQFWDGYDAVAQTDDAISWLSDRAENSDPFLLFLSWGPPHSPYQSAPEEFTKRFPVEGIQLRPNVPDSLAQRTRGQLAGYYAHCAALDEQLGRLRQHLHESGLEQNTLLIFTSDHGTMLGSHAAIGKLQPYDESVCVPLVFFLPAKQSLATTHKQPITTRDVLPTILGLCGIDIPTSISGSDRSSLLTESKTESKTAALDSLAVLSCIEPFGRWNRAAGGREYRGLRTPNFTYARDLSGPWLLYNNSNDPYQEHNLVADSCCPQLVARLDSLLQLQLNAQHDQFLPGAAYLKRFSYENHRPGAGPKQLETEED